MLFKNLYSLLYNYQPVYIIIISAIVAAAYLYSVLSFPKAKESIPIGSSTNAFGSVTKISSLVQNDLVSFSLLSFITSSLFHITCDNFLFLSTTITAAVATTTKEERKGESPRHHFFLSRYSTLYFTIYILN